MTLPDTYSRVRPAVVAMVSFKKKGGFDITGTGFVISSEGITVTNRHVVDALVERDNDGAAPSDPGTVGGALLTVLQRGGLIFTGVQLSNWVVPRGDGSTDLGLVRLAATGLPHFNLAPRERHVREGERLATAGWPYGNLLLEKLRSFGPVLQEGIVSGIMPFPTENPGRFHLGVPGHPGMSGSPTFDPVTGEVVGAIYGSLPVGHGYEATLCVPSSRLWDLLDAVGTFERCRDVEVKSYDQLISEGAPVQHMSVTVDDP